MRSFSWCHQVRSQPPAFQTCGKEHTINFIYQSIFCSNISRQVQEVRFDMSTITSHLWRWCNTQVVDLCHWGVLDPPDRWPPCFWKWASPLQRAQGEGNAPPPGLERHMRDPTSCWRTLVHLVWVTSGKTKSSFKISTSKLSTRIVYAGVITLCTEGAVMLFPNNFPTKDP